MGDSAGERRTETGTGRCWVALLSFANLAAIALVASREPARLSRLAADREEARAARGRGLFRDPGHKCTSCHGHSGLGTWRAPALNSASFLEGASRASISDTIANGVDLTDMRPFSRARGGPLGSEEIEALAAFVLAWRPNAPAGERDPRRKKPAPRPDD